VTALAPGGITEKRCACRLPASRHVAALWRCCCTDESAAELAADALVVTTVRSLDQLRNLADTYQALLDCRPDGRGTFYSTGWLQAFAPMYLAEGRRCLYC